METTGNNSVGPNLVSEQLFNMISNGAGPDEIRPVAKAIMVDYVKE